MVNPIIAEATRGRHIESVHRGAATIVDSQGHVVRAWGNIKEPIFARSALKFVQALPLLESGAAEAYHLTDQEIALACASHHGEEMHINVLESWLQKLGKDERILECGIHPPISKMGRSVRDKPSVLQNTCSGKHLGFLTTALHRNEPLEGYGLKDHPIQRRIEHVLSEMTNIDLNHAPQGIDGCSIPAYAIPLYNIALAMARFADPSHLHYPRQKAIHRILEAVKNNPEMVGGEEAFDTKLIRLSQGKVLCKSGAGGVEIGIVPSLGLGIALKIDDGNLKATQVAFLAILKSLGILDDDIFEALQPRLPILTHRGKTVGFLQPTNFTTIPHEIGHH